MVGEEAVRRGGERATKRTTPYYIHHIHHSTYICSWESGRRTQSPLTRRTWGLATCCPKKAWQRRSRLQREGARGEGALVLLVLLVVVVKATWLARSESCVVLCVLGAAGVWLSIREDMIYIHTQLLLGSLPSYLDEGRGPAAITTSTLPTIITTTVAPIPRAVPPELPHVFPDVDAHLNPYRACMCN